MPITPEQYQKRADESISQYNERIASLRGEPTNVAEETPAGTLPSLSGSLSNFRTVLREAATEASNARVADRLRQFSAAGFGRTPGTLGSIADIIRGQVKPRVEGAFEDAMQTLEERRKEIEFNPDQFRSTQGGIYDLKNNKWVISPKDDSSDTVGSRISLIGGLKVSSETKQVIDGFTSITDYTPSQKQKVISDLFALGYNSDKAPDWFTQQLQSERMQSILPEKVKEEWNNHRALTLYGKQLSADFIKQLYSEDELTKEAKKSKMDVNAYLQNLQRTIELYRDQGFTDKEIINMMTK